MDGGFVVNLDSVAQRNTFDQNPQDAMDGITGVLRVGCLLTGNLLLTDAQVLDGALLLRIGPSGITKRIGTSWEIYARSSNLEDSLAALFDVGNDSLRRIELSSVPNLELTQRIALGGKIAQFPSARFRILRQQIGTINAVCEVLRICDVDHQSVDELRRYWSTWIEADKDRSISVVHKPHGKIDIRTQVDSKPMTRGHKNTDFTSTIEKIQRLVDGSATRSEMRSVIENLVSEEEKDNAREWLDAVYVRAIANQYNSVVVEIPRSSVDLLRQRRAVGEREVSFGTNSMERLCEVRMSTFEMICDKTRDDARRWRTSNKNRHMRHLASTVRRDTTTDYNIRRERSRSAVRLGIIAVIVQITTSFDYGLMTNVVVTLTAVALTEIIPILYLNLFPKGELNATVDPVIDR